MKPHKRRAPDKALTCETCRYFDAKAGWCRVYATWRSRYTRRCTYGELLARKKKP